jgi:hypothetical protein
LLIAYASVKARIVNLTDSHIQNESKSHPPHFMSTESDSSTIPETYLAKAKQLLDDEAIDEASRTSFFSALQSYLAGDPPADVLSFPPESAPVWARTLKLVIKFIAKTPASPPASPKTPTSPRTPGGHRLASERISDLIRFSPRQSFQDRVLGTPVPESKPDDGTEADAPTFSQDFIDADDDAPPKVFPVEMTEADFELLQKRKQELSQSKVVVDATLESSDFKIDDVITLSDGD